MTAPHDGSTATVSPQIRLLIAEDEANLGMILEQFMSARGFAVTRVNNGREALDQLRRARYDVALLDIVMPQLDGLEVLRQLRTQPLPPEVIVITGNGTLDTALAAIKLGAYDFLSKPYRMAEIEALVRRAWEKRVLARNNAALSARLARAEPMPVFETQFAPMRAMLSLVERVADSDAPVLVSGEPGTGKESLARHMHAVSARASEPFVVIDDPGAFVDIITGASGTDTMPGTTSAADVAASGTLYLHQVHRLSRDAQRTLGSMLVRGVVETPDDARCIPFNARVIASTTLDDDALTSALDDELLRLLSTIRVTLPPLRERPVDIPLLAERLMARDERTRTLAADALPLLEQYAWPGNVSELKLVLDRAALLAGDNIVEATHLTQAGLSTATGEHLQSADNASLDLAGLERRHIAQVLLRTNWHQGKAAQLLGISPKTLYRKIREYGFRRPKAGRE